MVCSCLFARGSRRVSLHFSLWVMPLGPLTTMVAQGWTLLGSSASCWSEGPHMSIQHPFPAVLLQFAFCSEMLAPVSTAFCPSTQSLCSRAFTQLSPSPCWCMGLFCLGCRALCFPLLNPVRFLWPHPQVCHGLSLLVELLPFTVSASSSLPSALYCHLFVSEAALCVVFLAAAECVQSPVLAPGVLDMSLVGFVLVRNLLWMPWCFFSLLLISV